MEELDLSYNRFESFPPEVLLLALKSLNFEGNKINSISVAPKFITEAKIGVTLQQLNLSYNKFTSFPTPITLFLGLKVLKLSHNALVTIPTSLASLRQLTELDLSSNAIEQFPAIGNLKRLVKLDLSNNKISDVGTHLYNLVNLRELYLAHNLIADLSESIDVFTQLRYLKLNDNKIRHLPKGIGRLTKLRELYLQENLLDTLPSTIGGLQSLTLISLENNQLSSIPVEFAQLSKMRFIYLHSNNFSDVPKFCLDSKFLSHVFHISLGYNQLPPTFLIGMRQMGALEFFAGTKEEHTDSRVKRLSNLMEKKRNTLTMPSSKESDDVGTGSGVGSSVGPLSPDLSKMDRKERNKTMRTIAKHSSVRKSLTLRSLKEATQKRYSTLRGATLGLDPLPDGSKDSPGNGSGASSQILDKSGTFATDQIPSSEIWKDAFQLFLVCVCMYVCLCILINFLLLF